MTEIQLVGTRESGRNRAHVAAGSTSVAAKRVRRDSMVRGRLGREASMARAIWSGAVRFGLVSGRVTAYTAVCDHDFHFHELERETKARVRH